MRRLRAALRPGALVGVIDRKGIGTDHGLNADVVIKEAAQAGYELVAAARLREVGRRRLLPDLSANARRRDAEERRHDPRAGDERAAQCAGDL